MTFLISFLVARAANFTFVGAAQLVLFHVFSDGSFSTTVFWVAYVIFEALVLALTVWSEIDFKATGPATRGGVAIGQDGRPPWADAEDRRQEKLARGELEDA